MKLFELFGRVNLKDEISVSISKIIDKVKKLNLNMEDIGKKSTELGKKMSLLVTAPIAGAGVAMFKLASDMEESLNKVSVTFGENADDVRKWSNTTLQSFGIAKNTALDASALYGDMATSMGLTTLEASDMATSLTGLAGDLSSFKNINIQQSMDALKGVFTGETESLKNLGIVMTQANLETFALTQGIDKNIQKMSESELVNLRYAFIMSKTTNAQGDFARTSEGSANQMRIFTESLKELGATFGANLLPTITSIITKVNDFLTVIGSLSVEQQKLIIIVGGLVASIAPLLLIVGNLITSFIAIKPLLVAIGGAFGAISAPIWIIIGVITALVATFTILWKTNEDFRNKVIEIWTKIKEFFIASFEFIKLKAIEIFESLKAWWDEWGFAIVDIFVIYFTILKNTVETVFNVIKAFWEVWGDYIKLYFKFALEQIMNTFKFAFDIVKNIVVTTFTIVKNIIENVIGTTRGILKAVLALMQGDFAGAFDAIKYVVKINLEQAKDIISAIFKFISNIFKDSFYFLKNIVDTNFSFISRLFKTFYDNSSGQTKEFIDNIKNFFESTWKFITNFIELSTNAIINIIKGFIDLFTSFWKGLWDGIRAILSNAWVGLNNSFNYIVKTIIQIFKNFGDNIKQVFANIWDNIKNTTVNAWEGIKNAVMNPINWIKNQIDKVFGLVDRLKTSINTVSNLAGKATGLASNIGSSVKSTAKSVIQKIPGLASGGNVVQSGRVLVGEKGAEYLDLPKGARVTPLDKNTKPSQTTNIKNEFNIANLVVREDADIKKIARELYNMQEAKRRGLGVIGNA